MTHHQREEFGEVRKAVCEQLQNNYTAIAIRKNLEIEPVQVAAVCIAYKNLTFT